MIGDSTAWPFGKKSAALAIATGGLLAGTVDLLQASILFGWNIPLTIAGADPATGTIELIWQRAH